MIKLGFPVIDLHTHLRNNIPFHTKIARENGIDTVIYMANCSSPLDNLKSIKKSLKKKRYCRAIPVSAITKNLAGIQLVDVDKIRPFVAGFSDDGNYLKNIKLLNQILMKKVLILAHCSPSYEIGIKKPEMETKFIERYLILLNKERKKIKGWLHIQHVSKKNSIELIKKAKKESLNLSCETCPHYFTYTKENLETKVNPPLAEKEDILAVKRGLADGTIDIIASDYAPLPRKTGIAGFSSFLSLSYGLVLKGVLTKQQLKEKLYLNPVKILKKGGYEINV